MVKAAAMRWPVGGSSRRRPAIASLRAASRPDRRVGPSIARDRCLAAVRLGPLHKGEAARAAEAMVNSKTTLVTLREDEGAGEHCHVGAMGRAHQTMFDWLDDVM